MILQAPFRCTALVALTAFIVCACAPGGHDHSTVPEDARHLQQSIDEELNATVRDNDAIRSVLYGLQSESREFRYLAAAGLARAGNEAPITTDHQFMIASVTKTIVATRILQLSESTQLDIDDRLADLEVFPARMIEELHRVDGKPYGDRITIRQLLNHTSGLKDYLLDDRQQISKEAENGVASGSLAGIWQSQLQAYFEGTPHPDCVELIDCDLKLYPAKTWRHWDANAYATDPFDRDAGLLNFYLAEMADAAVFPPGEGLHYSDTNYLLLGLVIEALSGQTLDEQLRTGIFGPLGMNDTYMSYSVNHEHPTARVSDWYAYDVPMVTAGADTSWDWAGGGIVTTTTDLLSFITALMVGDLFQHGATLEAMLDPLRIVEENGELIRGYGLGIGFAKTELGPRYGHKGAWGAQMYYYPDAQLAVVGTVNDYGSGTIGGQLVVDIASLIIQAD